MTSLKLLVAAVAASLLSASCHAFVSRSSTITTTTTTLMKHSTCRNEMKVTALNAQSTPSSDQRRGGYSRKAFLAFTASTTATLFPFVKNSIADDDTTITSPEGGETSTTTMTTSENNHNTPSSSSSKSIEGCPKPISGKPNNCVATSNIKQLENYSPPWKFEVSPEEAFARLKGLLNNESFQIVEIDEDAMYIRAEIPRINNVDSLEFVVRGKDKVVVFKSNEIKGNGLSDYGANKKRVDELRLRSNGVFSLMGDGLTADSIDGGKFGKRNGLAGQLKAFYGLQSGEGFESVFEE